MKACPNLLFSCPSHEANGLRVTRGLGVGRNNKKYESPLDVAPLSAYPIRLASPQMIMWSFHLGEEPNSCLRVPHEKVWGTCCGGELIEVEEGLIQGLEVSYAEAPR